MRVLPAVKHLKQLPRLIQQGLPHVCTGQWWYVASSLVNTLGSGLFYPFSVLYFHQVAGLSFPLVGLGLTLTTGVSLATVPMQGALVDRFGASRMVIAAHLLRAVGFLAYLLVHSFLAFILLAALIAIGNSTAAGDALIAEIAAPEERDRWFGLSRVLVNAGAWHRRTARRRCGGDGRHGGLSLDRARQRAESRARRRLVCVTECALV